MISEIGAGQKICLQARYEKAQDADPTTTICGMPVVRTATFDPLQALATVGFRSIKSQTPKNEHWWRRTTEPRLCEKHARSSGVARRNDAGSKSGAAGRLNGYFCELSGAAYLSRGSSSPCTGGITSGWSSRKATMIRRVKSGCSI
jgi:hypothetical protein